MGTVNLGISCTTSFLNDVDWEILFRHTSTTLNALGSVRRSDFVHRGAATAATTGKYPGLAKTAFGPGVWNYVRTTTWNQFDTRFGRHASNGDSINVTFMHTLKLE